MGFNTKHWPSMRVHLAIALMKYLPTLLKVISSLRLQLLRGSTKTCKICKSSPRTSRTPQLLCPLHFAPTIFLAPCPSLAPAPLAPVDTRRLYSAWDQLFIKISWDALSKRPSLMLLPAAFYTSNYIERKAARRPMLGILLKVLFIMSVVIKWLEIIVAVSVIRSVDRGPIKALSPLGGFHARS